MGLSEVAEQFREIRGRGSSRLDLPAAKLQAPLLDFNTAKVEFKLPVLHFGR